MRARRVLCGWAAFPAMCTLAATAFAAQAPQPETGPKRADTTPLRQIVAWQVALERQGFSPGVIDGKPGPKTLLALSELQRARGQTVTGRLDVAAAEALGLRCDDAAAVLQYTLQQTDADQVTGPFKGWLDKSKATRIGYRNLADELAEKFHCSLALLSALNNNMDLAKLKVGDSVTVPAVTPSESPHAARLKVNLSEKVIRCFNEDGRMVALFHCSIARDAERRPLGSLKVAGVTRDPEYLFDPEMWSEVKGIDRKLVIPPGPRNPVGLCWIALDRPGFGMHGTPNPELIGKTGSHGCFRLTNWDAVRLSGMVRHGTPVEILNAESQAAPEPVLPSPPDFSDAPSMDSDTPQVALGIDADHH